MLWDWCLFSSTQPYLIQHHIIKLLWWSLVISCGAASHLGRSLSVRSEKQCQHTITLIFGNDYELGQCRAVVPGYDTCLTLNMLSVKKLALPSVQRDLQCPFMLWMVTLNSAPLSKYLKLTSTLYSEDQKERYKILESNNLYMLIDQLQCQ